MGSRGSASITTMACAVAVAVSGCGGTEAAGSAAQRTQERAAIKKYRAYLDENAGLLVDWTAKMRGQIAAGDLPRAESRYAVARVQLGQIEPIARTFSALYPKIDARSGVGAGWESDGFHGIEKALFGEESLDRLKAPATRLLANVERLQRRLRTVPLRPRQIVGDALATMMAVATGSIPVPTEPYSHIDLVDISANVEGAEQAVLAVMPSLSGPADHKLSQDIEPQFEKVYAALELYGTPAREPQTRPAAAGARFVVYDELSDAQLARLVKPVAKLTALLARLRRQVVGSEEAQSSPQTLNPN